MDYLPYQRAFYDRLLATNLFGLQGEVTSSPILYRLLIHGPVNILTFFLLILTFTFGPGYQPIAFCFFPAVVILVLYTRSVPSVWQIWLIACPALTIGQFFAYAGTFIVDDQGPWQNANTVYMLPVSAGMSILICAGLMLDRVIARYGHMLIPFVEVFFGFPMIWTGVVEWMVVMVNLMILMAVLCRYMVFDCSY
jgi:hypothetical protein